MPLPLVGGVFFTALSRYKCAGSHDHELHRETDEA